MRWKIRLIFLSLRKYKNVFNDYWFQRSSIFMDGEIRNHRELVHHLMVAIDIEVYFPQRDQNHQISLMEVFFETIIPI